MTDITRRGLMLGVSAAAVAGCDNSVGSTGASRIDRGVSDAKAVMYREAPFTRELAQRAAGILIMPLVTKGGFIGGVAYGEGALQIGEATVDYYRVLAVNFGLQAGAQQYSSALFFMDAEHLAQFRGRAGWTMGVDFEYTVLKDAGNAGIDTNDYSDQVYAIVFGQAGILLGVSIEGSKYTRILP
ncbi:MAG: twin-arginine translocation pathway signal [Rhodobacteraceae bacterium]|nr:twin-arginine translocation pathway signal [Paracoccaceae bacterium]